MRLFVYIIAFLSIKPIFASEIFTNNDKILPTFNHLIFVFLELKENHFDTIEQIKFYCSSNHNNKIWLKEIEELHQQNPQLFNGLILEIKLNSLTLIRINNGHFLFRKQIVIDDSVLISQIRGFFRLNFPVFHKLNNQIPKIQEREKFVNKLKEVLFRQTLSWLRQIQLNLRYYLISFFNQPYPPKTYFSSAIEIAYWEKLQFPSLWHNLVNDLEKELSEFTRTGAVGDQLRVLIAKIYFFGNLVGRPICMKNDICTIDEKDEKLNFSVTIGTAIDTAQFIIQTNAKKVVEIFTGRGNLTLMLSLTGINELITIERDNTIDVSISWYYAIYNFLSNIPQVFWPKVTIPVFIIGDIFEIDIPEGDCVIMDPPYGRASFGHMPEAHAFTFLLDTFSILQKVKFKHIYSIVPAEWSSIIIHFFENPNITDENYKVAIESILRTSIYFKRKSNNLEAFLRILKNDQDDYIHNLIIKIKIIKDSFLIHKTAIQNVLGKELDILQLSYGTKQK